MVAGWMNRKHQATIEYIVDERRVLVEQLGCKPKASADSQRLGLARRAKEFRRMVLCWITPIVTTDTLLRW